MSKTKVLVTGANGYIGRHVVEQLLNMGADVLAADFSFDGVDERAQRVETPIFSGLEDIYEQMGKPDVCIHLAWRNGFVHNADSHIEDLPNHYLKEYDRRRIETCCCNGNNARSRILGGGN